MSLDEALLEYMRRVDAGEPVDREGFLSAHPECAGELRAYLQWSEEVDVMLGPEGAADLLLCDTADTLDLEAQALAQTPPAPGGEPAVEAARPAPGVVFHGYLIEAELHRGRALVFRAREGGRAVALKLLPELRPGAAMRQRLQRTADAWSRLEDPAVLPLLQAGVTAAGVLLVTPLCDGGDLMTWAARAPRDAAAQAHLLLRLAGALEEAHRHGLVHGALHPGNVLFAGPAGADGPLLTDFDLGLRDEGAALTAHTALAAPAYLAPEQARGAPLRPGPALDVYGLGALLYFLLAGRAPYVGVTPLDTRLLVVREPPAPPRAHAPQADPELEALCLRCLARDPAARPASAAAVAEALAALGAPREARAESRPPGAGAATDPPPDTPAATGRQPDEPAADAAEGTLGRALRWLRSR